MVTRYYWWLASRDSEGNPYLIFGSDKSEEDARQKGLEMLPGADFEIVKLATRDRDEASAQYRGKRLERTHSLDKASRRLGHEKSVRRARKRGVLGSPARDNW